MRKKCLLAVLLLAGVAVSLYAALPVTEYFNDTTIVNNWDQFWGWDSTLESVPAGTDGIPDIPGGNGYFGRANCDAMVATTSGHLTGESTDTNYTLQAWIWAPMVNTSAPPDDNFYQQLIFYRVTAAEQPGTYGYGQFHLHFNEDTTIIPHPRIRLRICNPSFVHTTTWEDPADFPASEGWHRLKVRLNGTTAYCYYDGLLLGKADWTSQAPERNAGKFGFGQYKNGMAARCIYVDEFKAWATGSSEPPNQPPPPTPTPLAATVWGLYY